MDQHSAWTIRGVDPAAQRAAEELAAQDGGLVQLLLAEYAASRRMPEDSSALRQKLVPLSRTSWMR